MALIQITGHEVIPSPMVLNTALTQWRLLTASHCFLCREDHSCLSLKPKSAVLGAIPYNSMSRWSVFLYLFVYVYIFDVCECRHAHVTVCLWRSGDSREESVLRPPPLPLWRLP